MKSSKKIHPMQSVVPEGEFLPLVQEYAEGLLSQCLITREPDPENKIFNRRFLGLLKANARVLEDFLDDHGAKRNRRWFYFRELVATAICFGETGYLIAFTQKRYPPDAIKIKDFDNFYHKMIDVQGFIVSSIIYIFQRIEMYAKKLDITPPDPSHRMFNGPDLDDYRHLPVNLGKPELGDDGKDIAKICSLYQNFVQNFESMACINKHIERSHIMEFIPEIINEECIRKFELEMHNLESVYDTYVNYRFREDNDPRLSQLRNYISIPLILLETARAWSHFYERHPKIYFELCNAVKDHCALDCMINWALYFCKKFITSGNSLAKEIMIDYTAKGSIELNIPQKMGFHLRPATLVAKVVNHYGSKVKLIVGKDKFDASSILSITYAGGKIDRDKIEKVTFVGDKRALKDLEILASVNYGEDSMGKDRPLPKKLSYLR